MADNIAVTNPGATPNPIPVSADEGESGNYVQRIKLAHSADSSEAHIGADANGLDVDVVRLPGTVEVDIADIKTALEGGGTALIDPVVDANGTTIPIKYKAISATADGDNLLITGVTSKKLRVVGYVFTATGAGLLTLKDDAASPNTLGYLRIGADGGGASYSGGLDAPAFETASGEGLVMNNPNGVDVYGHMAYVEV